MTFTKTPPRRPGAYWHRWGSRITDPANWFLVRVEHDKETGLLVDESSQMPPGKVGGEWCGPLVPAEEVGKAWEECARAAGERGYGKNPWANSRARRIVEGEEKL